MRLCVHLSTCTAQMRWRKKSNVTVTVFLLLLSSSHSSILGITDRNKVKIKMNSMAVARPMKLGGLTNTAYAPSRSRRIRVACRVVANKKRDDELRHEFPRFYPRCQGQEKSIDPLRKW
jgi:hypothetical protein